MPISTIGKIGLSAAVPFAGSLAQIFGGNRKTNAEREIENFTKMLKQRLEENPLDNATSQNLLKRAGQSYADANAVVNANPATTHENKVASTGQLAQGYADSLGQIGMNADNRHSNLQNQYMGALGFNMNATNNRMANNAANIDRITRPLGNAVSSYLSTLGK